MDQDLLDILIHYNIDTTFPFSKKSDEYLMFQFYLGEINRKNNLCTKHFYHIVSSNCFFANISNFFEDNFDSTITYRLLNFYKVTQVEPFVNPGVIYDFNKSKGKIEIDEILLDEMDNTLNVITAIHEYTHALLFDEYQVLSNFYYNELLSIFMEKVAAIYYEKKECDSSLLYCINESRLFDIKESLNLGESKKRIALYLLSDIYATHLFDIYRKDCSFVIKDINGLLNGNGTLQDLLDDYKINMKNDETVKTYQKVLNKY